MTSAFTQAVSHVWAAIDGDSPPEERGADPVTTGPRTTLTSAFDVTGLATAAVYAATVAAAEVLRIRTGGSRRRVTTDSRDAAASFAAERLLTPIGWSVPPAWDAIAGDYEVADGWIRLHTNYTAHRNAVIGVIGAQDREGIRERIATRNGADLEADIVRAGGAAAVMHSRQEWQAHSAGNATASEPPIRTQWLASPGPLTLPAPRAGLPFEGLRVLDLTRVIAGPVCTTFLAAYGADVLRIDPPGFREVPALVPETTLGKRTAALDLRSTTDRRRFEELLTEADVLICGLRADALTRLGYDDARLTSLNPDLLVASLNAYGWQGPWKNRRGFDSLVQMSCGIADDGARARGGDGPVPLPVQALDHGTGWLLAAAIAAAVRRRLMQPTTAHIHASLVGTANLLYSLTPPHPAQPAPPLEDVHLIEMPTAWGPVRRALLAGRIEGCPPHWAYSAGPLGRHAATWLSR